MKRLFAFGLLATLCFALLLAASASAQDFNVKPLSKRIAKAHGVEYVRGEVLVKYRQGTSQMRMMQLDSELGARLLATHRGGVRRLAVPAGKTEQELIDLLKADPNVEYAELNTICKAAMVPNDPYYDPYQWHFPRINCPQAWDISAGSGSIVGILDTGVAYENYTVPSYERNTVASGVTQYQVAPELNGTSFTAGYDFVNNDTHPNDNNGHGTHVAGTIAQVTNNGTGTAGMAFDCTIMPVKVLDYSGSGTAQSLSDALYWAADNGAQVINMSLSWPSGYNPGTTVHNAIQYAYNAGVVLCAASGNEGVGTVSYPAAYSECIAVGATRYDDQLTSYSQYGSAQEVTAPGGDIMVDQNGDGYGDGVLQMTFSSYDPGPPEVLADPTDFGYWFYEGTSMATPHVVALCAMMIANGQTGVENIRSILHDTAVDLGTTGWDSQYGYGRIDAYAALSYGGTPPVADFSGSPTSGCATLTVNFTDASTGDIDTWDWNFGDGSAHSSAQNPSHDYTAAGDYTVTLTVSGTNGSDSEVKTNYIHVDEAPAAAFTGSPTSGCAPLTVSFTDQSTGSIDTWDWDFGDGSAHSSAQNPSHDYTAAGDYTVTLTVSGPCGSDAAVKTNYVSVGATLVADFSGTPTSGCAPLTVNFTDASTGDITSWDWDFGDGSAHSSAQNPSHQYTGAGDYSVTLTVTGSCGSDAKTRTNYVSVQGAPVAGFYGSPTSGDAPLTVSFYDQSTGGVTSWDWDFGDGSAHSSAQNPTHEYTTAGLYTVTLTATGPCGSDPEVKTDYINVTEPGAGFCDDFNDGDASDWTVVAGTWSVVGGQYDGINTGGKGYTLAPTADMSDGTITVDWTSLTGGSWTNGMVVFAWQDASNYRVIDMRDGANKWYIREFIGGTRYNRAQLAETINTNQQYHVEVVVGADGLVTLNVDGVQKVSYNFSNAVAGKVGVALEKSHSQFDNFCVTVSGQEPPPVAEFSGTPTSGCAPLSVDFTDLSTGTIDTWDWDFGDASAHSSAQNPTHEYTAAGDYTVTLTVTGPGGSDSEAKTNYISVTDCAAAIGEVGSFTQSQASGTTWYTVNLNNTYTSPVVIAKALSTNDAEPAHIRVKNVTSNSFQWQIEEWEYEDGAHGSETISYMALEAGRHTLEDGTVVEAGTASVNNNWATVSFSSAFGSTPALLTSVTTVNDGIACVARTRNLGTGSFQAKVQEEEAQSKTHANETVGWLAIEQGTGSNGGRNFHAGRTSNSVTHAWYDVSLTGFSSTPIFLCHDDTYDGGNTCSARWQNLGASSVQVKIEEEQSRDTEVNHITEAVSYLAWASAGNIAGAETVALGSPEAAESPAQFDLPIRQFAVSYAAPNPFTTRAQFTIDLPKDTWVRAVIYDVAGRKVRTVLNDHVAAGTRVVTWNGTNDRGERVPGGIYFCNVTAGSERVARKMILAR